MATEAEQALARDTRLAALYTARGQTGAASRFNIEERQRQAQTRESQLNPSPQIYSKDSLKASLSTGDRQVLAAQLRAQATYADQQVADAKARGDRDARRYYERVADYSRTAANTISSGEGEYSNEERVQVGRSRSPEASKTQLRASYLVGEARRSAVEANSSPYSPPKVPPPPEATQNAAQAQRTAFEASGGSIPGAYGRYVQDTYGSTTQVSSQQQSLAAQQLVKEGKASPFDPETGKPLRYREGQLLGVRTKEESARIAEQGAREAAASGAANFQDTQGRLFQVTNTTQPVAEINYTPVPASEAETRRKVVFKDTAIAQPVRKTGQYLQAISQKFFEEPTPFDTSIRNTPVVGAAFETLARGTFKLGQRLEGQPDREVGKLIITGGVARGIGTVAGETVSLIGRASPTAAVYTERGLAALGIGYATVEVVRNPEEVVANAPEIAVGVTQFAKGYKLANPAPVVELGEPRFQSTGTIATGARSTVLGQYAEGSTPVKITQYGKVTETQAPTRAFITGSNQVAEGTFKSSIKTLTDVQVPGRKPQTISQDGNLLSGDVGGVQYQLLGVQGQPARLLVFEEPILQVGASNKAYATGTYQPAIAQRGTPFRTLTVDPATSKVTDVRAGFSNIGVIETKPSSINVFLSPKGTQAEFSTDVLAGAPLKTQGVKPKVIRQALEAGRAEGIIPQEPATEIVYGYEVLAGSGRRGQFSFTRPEVQPTVTPVTELQFNPFRDIPQVLPTSTVTLTSPTPSTIIRLPSSQETSQNSRAIVEPQPVPRIQPREISRQVPRQIPETIPQVTPRTVPETIPREITRQVPRQIPESIAATIPETIPKTVPETIPKTVPETIPRPFSEPVPEPFPPSFIRDKEKRTTPLYDVQIRRQGQFRPFTTQGLRLTEAVKLAERVTDTTAAASFKIISRETGLPVAGEERTNVERILRPGRYTTSKVDQNIFVERSKYRISTGGEKLEIRPKRGIFAKTGASPFGRVEV